MTERPEFIDNRGGNTLECALRAFLGVRVDSGATESTAPTDEVRIATAFFSPSGFARIAGSLEPASAVRLLLGADPATGEIGERKQLDETPEMFKQRCVQKGLRHMDDVLCNERDHLPFTRANGETLRKLTAALRAGNMEVKRYEEAFMHAKAYIVTPKNEDQGKPEGVIVGSSNLTKAGLAQNLELNLGRYDRPIVDQARQWFDDLWEEAVPYELDIVFDKVLQPCSPWEIFIRVLWNFYGDEVEQDTEIDKNLPLTNFQKHGVARALRLIEEVGGVIVADEVGLGKTFIAGEILQRYLERRQRALLICPASLRDSTWKRFLGEHLLFVENLSFEQLANDSQLRDAHRPRADKDHLDRSLKEYQLVIVDEAHNYRNPDARTRAGTLRRLMSGQKRDLLLLTATPVNNSLWDLYHLLQFFLRQDAHLSYRGIPSIRQRFEKAMREDPSNLSPDTLYPIIDATTVKRTRQFIKKHYHGDTIVEPDGTEKTIVFPQPKAISVRYNLDDCYPGFFERLENALDPDSDGVIVFARYMPQAYLLRDEDDEKNARAHAMVGLLRSGLLKRFESSIYAFCRTVKKMIREHGVFLAALEEGFVVKTAFMRELSGDDDAAFEDVLDKTEHRDDADLYDVAKLRAAVERDQDLLEALIDHLPESNPDSDPKLKTLVGELEKIVQQAKNDAKSDSDEKQKRKVLIFSFFEDTVVWIRDYLSAELDTRPKLVGYRGHMAAVSGSGNLAEASWQKAVLGFAPDSMKAPEGQRDLYDLMITTDVLAEGVNLQQCRHIINFDVPWNPMRLVQRHGRIDRIDSPHKRVFLRTIFPVDRLEQLLKLEQKIRYKLAMAAVSVGVASPIEGAAHGTQVFTESREEIEKLLEEDASLYERGGTVGAAQTGEEYRQTLRQALNKDRDSIVNMPWKAGSGMIADAQRGIFFCAVVCRESKFERTYLRFVSADRDWQPQSKTDENGATIPDIEREIGACLRLIECEENTDLWCPEWLRERVYDFWEVARDDIHRDWEWATDPANLQPEIRPLNRRVAEFIRDNPPTDLSKRNGQDRFEKALNILESPWPYREEVKLRELFEKGDCEGRDLSRIVIDFVHETGLEAVVTPEPLMPISPDEIEDNIELLCWMGIESDSENLLRGHDHVA